MEIPEFIADKPKKAMQYTMGVTKALQRKAKDERFTLREYVNNVFGKIFPDKLVKTPKVKMLNKVSTK
jgi:hypothetical protein